MSENIPHFARSHELASLYEQIERGGSSLAVLGSQMAILKQCARTMCGFGPLKCGDPEWGESAAIGNGVLLDSARRQQTSIDWDHGYGVARFVRHPNVGSIEGQCTRIGSH